MNEQLPFGIDRHTFASLSPSDLEQMGKSAADCYLCEGIPLNEAVVKLARQHPSISSHQVQRVIEYANQETFSQIFEKQAGDKNIEFPLADPVHILHELNNGASPHVLTPPPEDYGMGALKMAHSDVEADLVLSKMFMGVDFASPGSEKTASARLLGDDKEKGAADRILAARESGTLNDSGTILSAEQAPMGAKETTYDEAAIKEAWPDVEPYGSGSQPQMDPAMQFGMSQPMDDSQYGVDPYAQQQDPYAAQMAQFGAMSPEDQQFWKGSMGPIGGMGPMAGGPGDAPVDPAQMAQMEQAHGQQGGAPPPAQPSGPGAPEGEDHYERMMQVQQDIEYAKKEQELQSVRQKTLEGMTPQSGTPGVPPMQGPGAEQGMPPEGMPPPQEGAPPEGAPPPQEGAPQGPPPQEMPPAMAGPLAAPPGSEMPKTGSARWAVALTKEAMAYVKSGRPNSNLVVNDLRQATSVDRIKQAAATRGQYRQSNPHGEILRTFQKISKVLDQINEARHKNLNLTKEAQAQFHHEVTQHMLGGGNLGEVLHAVGRHNLRGDIVKQAMADMVAHLTSKGMDPVRAQADTIHYEMAKVGSVRVANPNNPIVQSFNSFYKLAAEQGTFDQAHQDVLAEYKKLESFIQSEVRHAAAI